MNLWLKLWLAVSAWCSASLWVLSLVGQLRPAGYAAAFLILLALLGWLIRAHGGFPALWRPLRRWPVRLRKPRRRRLPALFLLMTLLALCGGVFYSPMNPDTLQYRIPRILNWFADHHWSFIHTPDPRLNFTGLGMEAMWAPLLAATHSVRGLFLPNILSFLLLPGAVYLVLTELGVRRRVAWAWMWLVPAGWVYVLQAGTSSTDAVSAVWGAAAVGLALRARRTLSVSDWCFACLGAAVMTSVKQTNLPLLLPIAIALIAAIRAVINRPLALAATAIVAATASVLPLSLMNMRYGAGWMGYGENVTAKVPPHIGLVGNVVALAAQNLTPPLFPMAGRWNAAMDRFLASDRGAPFRGFERFAFLDRAVKEETVGFGLLPLLFLVCSIGAAYWLGRGLPKSRLDPVQRMVLWGSWIALVVFMAKIVFFNNARLIAGYGVLLLAGFLTAPGHQVLVRRRAWQTLAALLMLTSALLVVFSRRQPLWPEWTVLETLHKRLPGSTLVESLRVSRAWTDALPYQMVPFVNEIPSTES